MPGHPIQLTQVGGQPVSYRLIGGGARRVVFFHGFPGSSVQINLFDSRIEPDGLTVLCVDRPGYGKSAAADGAGQLSQGIRHCRGVLEKLGWDEYDVFAVSGGTPLALSFAHAMHGQVRATTISCGLGLLADPRSRRILRRRSRLGLALLPRVPARLLAYALRPRAPGAQAYRRDLALLRFFFDASVPDQEVLASPDVQGTLVQAKIEAFAQGGLGPRADAHSYVSPWGWELSSFAGPLRFFHGTEDRVIPPGMARFMANATPGAELTLVPGEGHFSLPVRRLGQMLQSVVR